MLLILMACGSSTFPPTTAVFAEALARFDGDKDGTLSQDELARYDPLPETFTKMDRGADGKVDLEEFTYFVHANQPRALVSRKGMGPK